MLPRHAILVVGVFLCRCVAASVCTSSDGGCGSDLPTEPVSLLQVGLAMKSLAHDEEKTQDSNGPSLNAGEYTISSLKTLPTNMGTCDKLKNGGCGKWKEFVSCGKSEDEVYNALLSKIKANQVKTRIVIGARSSFSPNDLRTLQPSGKNCDKDCTDSKHKWQKKNKDWGFKCGQSKCEDCSQCAGITVKGAKVPYASAQPATCSGGQLVQFLVNNYKNIGASVTEGAGHAMTSLGLKQPFNCDTEHWFRQRISETLEMYPTPYLLQSFPDVVQSQKMNNKGLVEQAIQIEEMLENVTENEQLEDEETSLLQHQQTLLADLTNVEDDITKSNDAVTNRMAWIRKRFGHDHGIALGPRFIRMTFHDAADYENLIDGFGTRVCGNGSSHCGGVDFRLHTALLSVGLSQNSLSVTDENDPDFLGETQGENPEAEESPLGDPNHNRGLDNAIHWVRMWGQSQTILSQADVMVLGAHVAVEAWLSGPEMTYRAGRIDADHDTSKIKESDYCTREDCEGQTSMFLAQPVAEPVGDGMFCPATNTVAGLGEVLGLNQTELIALQGSHSIGGIIRCSGMGNTGKGPFCGGVKCCPPGMIESNGQCECRTPDCQDLNAGMNGASFDGTPNKLDNMYYKQLSMQDFSELPECDEVSPLMPGMGSADQALYICMKKKAIKWQGNRGNASWQEVVDAGCAERVKGSYQGGQKEQQCRSMWGTNGQSGTGFTYPKRSWCDVDACMDSCQKSADCGEASLQEVSVLMSKFQNRNYFMQNGKPYKCFHTARLIKGSNADATFAALIAGILQDQYKNTLVSHDVMFTDAEDGGTFSAMGFAVLKGCYLSNGGKTCTGRDIKMRTILEQNWAAAPVGSEFELRFGDPADPKCNQCTLPACQDDATAALEAALGFVKPQGIKHNAWLDQVLGQCKACKETCLVNDAVKNGPADNKSPEWCLVRSSESFCARGGVNHECDGAEKFSIPNHGDGRRTLIWNTVRWTRFRGQTRRLAMLPADWSNLGSEEGRAIIHKFATDNVGWQKLWAKVFQKVSEAGMAPEAARQCSPVSCKYDGHAIVCADAINPGIGPQTLTFDHCSPKPAAAAGAACMLNSNFGVQGVFTCDGSQQTMHCTTARGRENIEQGKKELAYGSDHDTCFPEFKGALTSKAQGVSMGEMRADDQ